MYEQVPIYNVLLIKNIFIKGKYFKYDTEFLLMRLKKVSVQSISMYAIIAIEIR